MFETADIAQRVEDQVRRMAQIPATDDEFTRDVHLFDHGYLDSFGAAELVSFVESEFSVPVSDRDLAQRPLNTVNEIASFISERIVGRS